MHPLATAPRQTLPAVADTHVHLADPAFDGDRDVVLSRSLERGVRLLIAVGYDLETSRRSLEFARNVDGIAAAVGIHPNQAGEASAAALAQIREWAADPEVVAVGETGLDHYRRRVPADVQTRCLGRHLEIADSVDKPVVIHDREAHEDLLAILLPWARARAARGLRSAPGVFHCFSGSHAMAASAVEAGFYVSFAGNLTYSKALAEVARQVDLRQVVVETDAPYLSPSPLRGRRNEPANVILTAQRLAEIRGLPLSEVVDVTTENARRLFGLS